MSDWTGAVAELDLELAGFYDEVAGSALKSIVIQSTTRTRNKNGEMSNVWATFASVEDVSVTEQGMQETDTQADRLDALEAVEFDMPYTAGVTNQMRILYNSKTYYISSVQTDATDAYRTIADTTRNLTPDTKP